MTETIDANVADLQHEISEARDSLNHGETSNRHHVGELLIARDRLEAAIARALNTWHRGELVPNLPEYRADARQHLADEARELIARIDAIGAQADAANQAAMQDGTSWLGEVI